MSNFGAITTTFTPPPACSATNVYLSASGTRSMYMQAPTDTELCFPSGYNPQEYGGYFSPAQCPLGYTAACISLETIGTVHETVVTCCPSYPSTMFACNTPHWQAPWQSTLGCTSVFTGTVTLTSISVTWDDIVGTISQKTETEGGMNAYSVQVRHRSGDFKTMTTTTLPVPGVTTTVQVPIRDIDLLSPSAFAAAACTTALFVTAMLAGAVYFCLSGNNSRRRGARNGREGQRLLQSERASYQSTERRVLVPKDPPPPYFTGQSSSSEQH